MVLQVALVLWVMSVFSVLLRNREEDHASHDCVTFRRECFKLEQIVDISLRNISAKRRLSPRVQCGVVSVPSPRHGDPHGQMPAIFTQLRHDTERNARDNVRNLLHDSPRCTLVDGLPAGCAYL